MQSSHESLAERDKAHVWHPFTQMQDYLAEEPLIVASGDGVMLRDVNGKEYIDGVSSLWCNLHGHRRKRIDDAIRTQLDKVAHSTLLGLAGPSSIELAEKLVGIAPKGLEKAFYSDCGATAVEIALKMAFQYWQQNGRPSRKTFLALENAYHGDTIGAVSVGGMELFHKIFRPLLFDCYRAPSPYCYRCSLRLEPGSCGMACLAKLRDMVRRHADEVAAVVIEPLVQAAGGMIVMPPGFLKGVEEVCRETDTFLIADEVAVGFGRTGTMFACEREEVQPDLLACAKGLTGGYLPLAATLATARIFDGFCGDCGSVRTFFHGHTYTGNALACAAALGSLQVFEEDRVLERVQTLIAELKQGLERFQKLAHVGDIRQCGLIAGIELVRDRGTKEPYRHDEKIGHRVTLEARSRGLITRPLGNVIVILPPLSVDPEQLDRLMDIIYDAIETVTSRAG